MKSCDIFIVVFLKKNKNQNALFFRETEETNINDDKKDNS